MFQTLLNGSYNKERCEEVFRALIDKPRDPVLVEQALELALPVMGQVLRSKFRSIRPGTEEHEEILSTVPFKFFTYLTDENSSFQERFYIDPKTHKSFLFGWFRFEILTSLNRVRDKETRRREADLPSLMAYNADSSSATIETRAFVQQLPEYIFEKASKRIRFDGKREELCLALLESRVASRHTPDAVIRSRFGISQSEFKFFDDYVRVLIRATLIESQKMIERIPYAFEGQSFSEHDAIATENMTLHGEMEFWK